MLLLAVVVSLVACIVTLGIIHMRQRRSTEYAIACQLPGERMLPIVGDVMAVLTKNSEQTFAYLRECARKRYGGQSYRFWIFGTLHFNVIRAADLEALLSSTKHNTKSVVYDFLQPFMGTGLLTSAGQKWFHRRRMLTPSFHFDILTDFLAIFNDESAKLVEGLRSTCSHGDTILQEIIPRFTLNSICETAMGVKLDSLEEPDAYRENLRKMGQWLVFRSTKPFLHSNTIYQLSGLPLILRKYLRPVHDFSASVIRRRREAFIAAQANRTMDDLNGNVDAKAAKKKPRFAMLDSLLAFEASDCKQIDEIGIREEVDTFMFEGYDTTSAALTFCLLMLAHHPNEQRLVLEDIERTLSNRSSQGDEATAKTIRDLSVHEYSAMDYMDCFIRETLRLYPPVAFMGRQLTESLVVGDLQLPAGTQIHIHAYDMHRDPEQFPEPEIFNPQRFSPEHRDKRHPFAYLAFSAGPRNCIGQRFAMLEIKCLLAHILLKFHITPVTMVDELVFVSDIVLRSKYPIRVKFNPRSKV